jgi:hypothetical protein
MSPVDGLFIILSGAVVVALELASGAVVPDGALDDDGGEAGLIDELDDFESVLGGGAADFEGDGATTGGVVEVDDVVLDSRWQPATPSAMPVQSNVTRAALLIVISKSVNEGTPSELADSMPSSRYVSSPISIKFLLKNRSVLEHLHALRACPTWISPTADAQISLGAGNYYADGAARAKAGRRNR